MKTINKTIEAISDEMGNQCIGVRVRLLNRVITNIYDEALRPLGITNNQISILTSMVSKGFSTPGEIGHFLQMQKSTLSRNFDRMRKKGWLVILTGDDARSQRLRVTAKGKSVVKNSWPLWRSAQTKAKQMLGEVGATSVCDAADGIWSK